MALIYNIALWRIINNGNRLPLLNIHPVIFKGHGLMHGRTPPTQEGKRGADTKFRETLKFH